MVMEFFSPLNGDIKNEEYRKNFANYIQMSLPRASVWFRVENVKRCGKDGLITSRESGTEKRAVLYIDLTTSNEFILLNELKENMECEAIEKNQPIHENGNE